MKTINEYKPLQDAQVEELDCNSRIASLELELSDKRTALYAVNQSHGFESLEAAQAHIDKPNLERGIADLQNAITVMKRTLSALSRKTLERRREFAREYCLSQQEDFTKLEKDLIQGFLDLHGKAQELKELHNSIYAETSGETSALRQIAPLLTQFNLPPLDPYSGADQDTFDAIKAAGITIPPKVVAAMRLPGGA